MKKTDFEKKSIYIFVLHVFQHSKFPVGSLCMNVTLKGSEKLKKISSFSTWIWQTVLNLASFLMATFAFWPPFTSVALQTLLKLSTIVLKKGKFGHSGCMSTKPARRLHTRSAKGSGIAPALPRLFGCVLLDKIQAS